VRLVARHHHSSGDPECDAVFVLVSGNEGLTVQRYGTGITAALADEAPEVLDSDDVTITIPDAAWRLCGDENERVRLPESDGLDLPAVALTR